MSLVTLEELRAAQKRLQGVAFRTPLVAVGFPETPGRLWIKAEALQPIGSFKLRGAYNKVALLPDDQRARGVITYSSGNHAQGVAYAARALGAKAVIVMPSNAPETKKRATAALGAEIVFVGPASLERKQKAEELAAAFGYIIIPPYDDPAIIAGQGTCGLEILEDLPDVDVVLVPVGGGGLISGVASAVKLLRPEAKVIGVEPELANDAAESFRTGKIVTLSAEETSRTIGDGLRTQSVGVLNFAHIQAYVDDIVTVSEAQIREAMRRLIPAARLVPEPSGAVAFAGALFGLPSLLNPSSTPAPKVAVVMSGGNVEKATLVSVLQEAD
jgi:threonine dehydratase